MSARPRVISAIYPAHEFNKLLLRVPRWLRHSVDLAPPDHVGLVVQRQHVPGDADLSRELARLEHSARRQLA